MDALFYIVNFGTLCESGFDFIKICWNYSFSYQNFKINRIKNFFSFRKYSSSNFCIL